MTNGYPPLLLQELQPNLVAVNLFTPNPMADSLINWIAEQIPAALVQPFC